MPRAPKFIPVAASRLAPSPPNLFTGTSGWAYTTWKRDFYPADLPSRGFLHYYAARLTSVEVNYTFRKLPTAGQLQGWLEATPPGFQFSFKAPQRITHFQRLRESHTAVAEFVEALEPARLAGKLGPLLFQLPPSFRADTARLAALLDAPALAKSKSFRLAFEFRHSSWFTDETYDVLRSHNAALCVAESDDLVTPDVATADFRYYRLRKNGGYSNLKLKAFAAKFLELAETQKVFAYFKHEEAPNGALNATAMQRIAAKVDAQRKAGVL